MLSDFALGSTADDIVLLVRSDKIMLHASALTLEDVRARISVPADVFCNPAPVGSVDGEAALDFKLEAVRKMLAASPGCVVPTADGGLRAAADAAVPLLRAAFEGDSLPPAPPPPPPSAAAALALALLGAVDDAALRRGGELAASAASLGAVWARLLGRLDRAADGGAYDMLELTEAGLSAPLQTADAAADAAADANASVGVWLGARTAKVGVEAAGKRGGAHSAGVNRMRALHFVARARSRRTGVWRPPALLPL